MIIIKSTFIFTMRIRHYIIFLVLLLFISCKKKTEAIIHLKSIDNAEEVVAARPHAQIYMPKEIDMGDFLGTEMKKTISVKVENIGTVPLYIMQLVPECDCTMVTVEDSVVAPQSSTTLFATLDLSGYPSDSIRKNFDIISNSLKDRVATIVLKGSVQN